MNSSLLIFLVCLVLGGLISPTLFPGNESVTGDEVFLGNKSVAGDQLVTGDMLLFLWPIVVVPPECGVTVKIFILVLITVDSKQLHIFFY